MSHTPKLLDISDGKVSLNRDFVEFNDTTNWSPERKVEVFWHMIEECIYNNSGWSEERINKSLQAFTNAYELVKYKFQNIERNTGGRYFDHLVRVMESVIKNTKEPSIKKTLIAICHDLIEDTDIDFYTLKSILGTHVALGTLLISKEPIHVFLNSEDLEILRSIERTGILNLKSIPSDEFLQRKSYNPDSLSTIEKEAFAQYKTLEGKYKTIRDKAYFSHMFSDGENIYSKQVNEKTPSINTFYNHAISLLENTHTPLNIWYPELKQIIFDALEVKFWDRIDNLRTTEIYNHWSEKNLKKAQRKIGETKKYFFPIAQEFDMLRETYFFSILQNEIIEMEKYITKKRIEITL